jgi:anaerobic selenocysteine-containing dehydrogenase
VTAKITKTPSYCAQCRSRCGCLVVVADDKLIRIEPLAGHPSGEKLCPKGKAAPELIYHPDRLTHPLRRTSAKDGTSPSWEIISWEEALDEISNRMRQVRDDHGAEQVAFSVTTPSGTHISDSISWIERFIRAFGSPNIIYGTEICNWHKDVASRFTYGTDIGTPDFANTDCVLLWGNNPSATWLARSVEIQKAIKRGAKMIVVDPRPTLFARRADCWLRVKPGTDQALALGIAQVLIEDNGFDHSFVAEWSNGPLLVRSDTGAFLRQSDIAPDGDPNILLAMQRGDGALLQYHTAQGRWLDSNAKADLRANCIVDTMEGRVSCLTAFGLYAAAVNEHPLEWVETVTGVPVEEIRQAAKILANAASTAYYAWNGVSQSATATQTDRAISLLYGLTGSYGDKGGNVPGGAAPFADISGHDLLSEKQQAKALGLMDRPMGPARMGWVTARDVYHAVLERTPYPVSMLFSFGGNLLSSQPDTDLAIAALKKLDFHVHADLFLNPSANYADIVLPVATSWEREGLRTGFDASVEGMRRVQLRPRAIEPLAEARSDTDIVLALASRLGLSEQLFGCESDKGHDHILAPTGLSVAQLRAAPEGITLPTKVPYRSYSICDASRNPKGFPTSTRKLEIYSETLLKNGYDPIPVLQPVPQRQSTDQFPLQLSCAKTVAYCHSQHRNIKSLRRLMPDPILEMSKEAAETRNIENDDWVEVSTAVGVFVAKAKVIRDIEPASVFAQHGWWVIGANKTPYGPDNPMAANMNRTIATDLRDPISGSIPIRSSYCNVEKMSIDDHGKQSKRP